MEKGAAYTRVNTVYLKKQFWLVAVIFWGLALNVELKRIRKTHCEQFLVILSTFCMRDYVEELRYKNSPRK